MTRRPSGQQAAGRTLDLLCRSEVYNLRFNLLVMPNTQAKKGSEREHGEGGLSSGAKVRAALPVTPAMQMRTSAAPLQFEAIFVRYLHESFSAK